MSYPYSQGDRLNDRNTYFYSEFHGRPFLDAWQQSRDAALATLPPPLPPPWPEPQLPDAEALANGIHDTGQLLASCATQHALLDRLLQRFEVSKRIYRKYDADLKAVSDSGYDDLDLYLLFAWLCVDSQERPAALRFLNALLKTVDTLISTRARLEAEQGARLAWLIGRERAWVQRIAAGVDLVISP